MGALGPITLIGYATGSRKRVKPPTPSEGAAPNRAAQRDKQGLCVCSEAAPAWVAGSVQSPSGTQPQADTLATKRRCQQGKAG